MFLHTTWVKFLWGGEKTLPSPHFSLTSPEPQEAVNTKEKVQNMQSRDGSPLGLTPGLSRSSRTWRREAFPPAVSPPRAQGFPRGMGKHKMENE